MFVMRSTGIPFSLWTKICRWHQIQNQENIYKDNLLTYLILSTYFFISSSYFLPIMDRFAYLSSWYVAALHLSPHLPMSFWVFLSYFPLGFCFEKSPIRQSSGILHKWLNYPSCISLSVFSLSITSNGVWNVLFPTLTFLVFPSILRNNIIF